VRFGSTLSLDVMKRQLNSLHWPYIAPVILFHHELRVGVVAESLIIEESHAAYAFVLQSIFEMEPNNRDKRNSLLGLFSQFDFLSKLDCRTQAYIIYTR
jgi:hypothetical protein